MRYAIKLAYDGRYFHGYARQPNVQTVEDSIINACIELEFFQDPKSAMFRSSSRTDKGVSSLGTVIAFNSEHEIQNEVFELNNLFDHIVIYGISSVDGEFYPRYARKRIYRYYLMINDYSMDSLLSTAQLFVGEHDYSNFARVEPGKNPIRTIDDIKITKKDRFILIDFYAQTYLWHQIRRIISSIVKVEQGKIKRSDIKGALNKPNEKVDFGLSPPQYLILYDVLYDFKFFIDEGSKKKKDELKTSIINSF